MTVSPITKDPKLSLWMREGLSLPEKVEQFYEQISNGDVVTMIRWRPKPKVKTSDEA